MIFCMNKKKLDKVDNASLENLISLNVSKNDFFFNVNKPLTDKYNIMNMLFYFEFSNI